MRRIIITLDALQSTIPVEIRLRRLLKITLRSLDFRCADIREIEPAQPDTSKEKAALERGHNESKTP